MDQSVLNATSLKAVKRNGNDHCFSAGIICIHKTLDDGTKLKDMKDGSECIYSKIYIDCGNFVLFGWESEMIYQCAVNDKNMWMFCNNCHNWRNLL